MDRVLARGSRSGNVRRVLKGCTISVVHERKQYFLRSKARPPETFSSSFKRVYKRLATVPVWKPAGRNIFSPVHCLRVRSRTTLSHEWHPRTLRAQTLDRLAHPFYSPPPTALCAQVEWKMTGRVVRSRTTKCYYIAFYTTPTKRSRAVVVVLDFSPSRVTSIPLHDRIQKRWAPLSFIKVRLIYISSVFICANWASLDVTIVVSILFAFFALPFDTVSSA